MSLQDVARPFLSPTDQQRLDDRVRGGDEDGVRAVIMRAMTNMSKRPENNGGRQTLRTAWHRWVERKRSEAIRGRRRRGTEPRLHTLPDDVLALIAHGTSNRNRAALAGVSRDMRRVSRSAKDERVAELEGIMGVLKAFRLPRGPNLVGRIFRHLQGQSPPGVQVRLRKVQSDVDARRMSRNVLFVLTDHYYVEFLFVTERDRVVLEVGRIHQMTRSQGTRFHKLREQEVLALQEIQNAKERLQEAETRKAEVKSALDGLIRASVFGLTKNEVIAGRGADPALTAVVRRAWVK